MNKKYLIIGVIIIAAIAIYFFLNKKKEDKTDSTEEQANKMTRKNAAIRAEGFEEMVEENNDSYNEVDNTEFNVLRQEYYNKYKRYPPSNWTTTLIKNAIEEYDQIQIAIKKYYELEDKIKDDGRTKEDVSTSNLADIQLLIQETEMSNKQYEWKQKKVLIENLVNAYHENMTGVGTWAGDCKGYDTTTFRRLIDLKDNEKIYANEYFGTLPPVNVGSNWMQITKNPSKAVTIAGALPQLGESVDRDRASHSSVGKTEGLEWSKKLYDAYKNVSGKVNEYGEKY